MGRVRWVVRAVVLTVLAVALLTLAGGYLGAGDEVTRSTRAAGFAAAEPVVPPRDGVTVVATDSNAWLADEGDGPRAHAELVAFAPNGSLLYYDDSHDRYWDVDPSPAGDRTVVYAASDHLSAGECAATTVCTRNVIERANLTTGEVTRLYERLTPFKHSTRWHDVDRAGNGTYLVADIYRDRVFAVNVSTGMTRWSWEAQSAYGPESGGPFPRDWTHLNDVELLADGRVMVSLRNQDQVVFVDPETGLLENRTLGAEDDYAVLQEQHNPDYIPAASGGPAVVVGDSENNRVVEYQRTSNGSWERTWTWQDRRLQWPRDADRLPSGNTLVTDSNGNRVLEVAPSGEVVWEVDVAFPYEAERLGTGDESAGGESAAELGLASRDAPALSGEAGTDRAGILTRAWGSLKPLIPGPLLNGALYLLPRWAGPAEVVSATALLVAAVAWGLVELRWSSYRVDLRVPVRLRREE